MLYPIPPDPEPTDVELEAEKSRLRLCSFVPYQIARDIARFFWQARKRQEEADSFHAAFSSWVPDLDYAAYLESSMWRSIRERVLENSGHECAACFDRATQVHHRDYRPRVLTGRDDNPLVALCADCHRSVHYYDNGKRRVHWQDEEHALMEMVRQSINGRRITFSW